MPEQQREGRLRAALSSRCGRAALLIVLALVVAGCTGEEESTLSEADLPELVLQPSDLTGSWLQFDEGRQARADAPTGERSDPFRFGRIEGWKSRYRRPESASTRGPLVIESRADLFEDADGAKADLEAAEAELGRPDGGISDELAAPSLGDEAHAFSSPPAPRGQVRYLVVVWRYRNVTATLAVNGFQGGLELGDALRLARRQQARLLRAASS